MAKNSWQNSTIRLLLLGGLLMAGCSSGPLPGEVLDEAKLAGRDGSTFTHATEDYFHDMDGAVALSPQEIVGAICGWCGAAATTGCGTA